MGKNEPSGKRGDNFKSEILQYVREALQGSGDKIDLGCIGSSVETGEKAEGMDTAR